MVHYRFKMEYTRRTKNGERKVKDEEDLYIRPPYSYTLGDVIGWMKLLKNAVAEANRAVQRGGSMFMEITKGVYKDNSDPFGSVEQIRFDRWSTEFQDGEQDGIGIHLLPDTRYTEECFDLYLTVYNFYSEIKNI